MAYPTSLSAPFVRVHSRWQWAVADHPLSKVVGAYRAATIGCARLRCNIQFHTSKLIHHRQNHRQNHQHHPQSRTLARFPHKKVHTPTHCRETPQVDSRVLARVLAHQTSSASSCPSLAFTVASRLSVVRLDQFFSHTVSPDPTWATITHDNCIVCNCASLLGKPHLLSSPHTAHINTSTYTQPLTNTTA